MHLTSWFNDRCAIAMQQKSRQPPIKHKDNLQALPCPYGNLTTAESLSKGTGDGKINVGDSDEVD